MAVLIEAISAVIRSDALLAAFNGDWQGFVSTIRAQTDVMSAGLTNCRRAIWPTASPSKLLRQM